MPLIWRYVLVHALKILFLALTSIIALLAMMRLDEIAHIASLGATTGELFAFTGLQVPYLLPVALPLASLVAAFSTMGSLSQSQEIVAMRACGISLQTALAPVLMLSALLTLGNFYLASELAPKAHQMSNEMRSQLRRINPLLVLNNRNLLELQGFAGDILGRVEHGKSAENVFLALPPHREERMQLILGHRLQVSAKQLEGDQITWIGGRRSRSAPFDQLRIENTDRFVMSLDGFPSLLQKSILPPRPDQLPIMDLFAQLSDKSVGKKSILYSDLIRRFSLSFAVFSLALLGGVCGIQTERRRRWTPLLTMALLTSTYLIAYFCAKSLEERLALNALALLLPHGAIVGYGLHRLKQMEKGRA